MQASEQHTSPHSDTPARRRYVESFRALRQGRLACAVHVDAQAAGICIHCGRGVCRSCMVAVGDRRYCKADAERMLSRTRHARESKVRGQAVTAASALSFALGATSVGAGILFLILGLVAPSMQPGSSSYSLMAPTFSYFSSVFAFPSVVVFGMGATVFALGSVNIVAGTLLWRSSRTAAIVAVALAATTALLSTLYFTLFSVVGLVFYALVAMSVTEIGAVAAGWRHLR